MIKLVKMIGEDLYKIQNDIEDNISHFEYRQNATRDIDNILEVFEGKGSKLPLVK